MTWLTNQMGSSDKKQNMNKSRALVAANAFPHLGEQGVRMSSEVLTSNIWQECIESDISVNNVQHD